MARRKKLTKAKAKLILKEGMVHGKSLTKKQMGFFGARAAGSPLRKTSRKQQNRTASAKHRKR